MKMADIISGGISLGISIFIFTTTLKFPSLPGGIPGPALFPYILSCILGFFSVILICSGLFSSSASARQKKSLNTDDSQAGQQGELLEDNFQDDEEGLITPLSKREGFINMALVILGMAFFVLFVNKVGFILIGLVICAGLMWRLGVPLIKAICISTGTVMLIFWLFAKLMQVPLPLGVIRL